MKLLSRNFVLILENLRSRALQKCTESFSKRRHNPTLKVDPPVQAHQYLDCLNLRIRRRQLSRFVNIFVRQVFNRVSQNFQSVPRLCTDTTIPPQACSSQACFGPQSPILLLNPQLDRRRHPSTPSALKSPIGSFFRISNLPILLFFGTPTLIPAAATSCDPSH